MKSPEKVLAAIEYLADAEDAEIRDAFPIRVPPTTIRMALGAIVDQVPADAAELDLFLTNVAEFCQTMRSDDYVPAAV